LSNTRIACDCPQALLLKVPRCLGDGTGPARTNNSIAYGVKAAWLQREAERLQACT
jgi:hypothetical protein